MSKSKFHFQVLLSERSSISGVMTLSLLLTEPEFFVDVDVIIEQANSFVASGSFYRGNDLLRAREHIYIVNRRDFVNLLAPCSP